MIICHVCGFECEENEDLCPVCGAQLIKDEADAEQTVQEVDIVIEHPVLAASVQDVMTAEIFKDMLAENGIPYSCGEAEFSMRVTFGGGFAAEDIYVDKENIERAQQLYEDILNAEPQFDDELFEDDTEEE